MLTVFVCGHTPESFFGIKPQPHLRFVNLRELPIGKYQDNQLAEHRFFIHNPSFDTEYVGVATTSWGSKYPQCPQLYQLDKLKLERDVVYAPRVAPYNWAFLSMIYHLGSEKYLREMSSLAGLPLVANESIWSNTFICHREIYAEFIRRWRFLFDYFYDKYGTEMEIDSPDPSRRAGYFYERISTFVFANLGIRVQSLVPQPKTVIKLPLFLLSPYGL